MTTPGGITLKIGQLWTDDAGREWEVTGLDSEIHEVQLRRKGSWPWVPLSRFTGKSGGYKLKEGE